MMKRIDEIEFLRAISILYVLSSHLIGNLIIWPSPAMTWGAVFFNGASGVDLFFAISGFVIARDLLPRLSASRNWKDFGYITLAFWMRRAGRLLPSAWLWLVIILLAALYFNQSGAFKSFEAALRGTYAALLLVANLGFALCFGHVGSQYECGANFHYWSLSLEEQFYFLLPWAALLFRNKMTWALSVLAIIQFFYPRDLLGSMIRTDALLVGVLIALASYRPAYQHAEPCFLADHPWLKGGLTLGLCLILAIVASVPIPVLRPYQFALVAVPAGLLVFLASYDRGYLAMPSWIKPFMRWIGTRSYAIYLIHIPAFFATREIWFRLMPPDTAWGPIHTLPFVVTATILILVCCELNYRYLEMPLRKKGADLARCFLQQRGLSETSAMSYER